MCSTTQKSFGRLCTLTAETDSLTAPLAPERGALSRLRSCHLRYTKAVLCQMSYQGRFLVFSVDFCVRLSASGASTAVMAVHCMRTMRCPWRDVARFKRLLKVTWPAQQLALIKFRANHIPTTVVPGCYHERLLIAVFVVKLQIVNRAAADAFPTEVLGVFSFSFLVVSLSVFCGRHYCGAPPRT